MNNVRARLLAVTLIALSLFLTRRATAEPTFAATDPYSGKTAMSIRLIAPDGALVWTCDHTGEPMNMEPCRAPNSLWYRGPGTYVATAATEGAESLRITEKEFTASSPDESVEWDVSSDRVRRVPPGVAGVRVAPAPDRFLEGVLTNGSARPIYIGSYGPVTVVLEKLENAAWVPQGRNFGSAAGSTPLAPGESKRFAFPGMSASTVEAGRYRLVVPYDLEPAPAKSTDRVEERKQYEATSDPFDYTPGSEARGCGLAEWEQKIPVPAAGSRQLPFQAIARTVAGVFVLKSDGDWIRMDDGSLKAIARLPVDAAISVSSDRTTVLAWGAERLLSSDGGLTFHPIPGEARPRRTYSAFVGPRFLEFSNEGTVGWRGEDGVLTSFDLPVKAAWRSAAFRDELHGAIVGDCSVFVETSDGGKSWAVRPTPWPYLSQLFWDDAGGLWLTGTRAVFRRLPGATAFAQFQEKGCLAHDGGEVLSCPVPTPPGAPPASQLAAGFGSRPLSFLVRKDADRFDALPATPPQEGAFLRAVKGPDGSVLVMIMAPGQLLRIKGGTVDILAESPEAVTRRESRERMQKMMKDGPMPAGGGLVGRIMGAKGALPTPKVQP